MEGWPSGVTLTDPMKSRIGGLSRLGRVSDCLLPQRTIKQRKRVKSTISPFFFFQANGLELTLLEVVSLQHLVEDLVVFVDPRKSL